MDFEYKFKGEKHSLMNNWFHQNIAKPATRPPAHLKGQLAGYEIKYLNCFFFFFYGFCIFRLPLLLLSIISGSIRIGELIMTTIFFSVVFALLVFKHQEIMRKFLVLMSFMLTILAWRFGTFEGYFMPFPAITFLFNLRVSKMTILLNFIMNFGMTYFYFQPRMEDFVQNASSEDSFKLYGTPFPYCSDTCTSHLVQLSSNSTIIINW